MSRTIAALAVLLLVPATARAAEEIPVASLPDGTELTATYDRERGLCVDSPAGASCGPIPITSRELLGEATDGGYVYGAVSDAVAAVEVVAGTERERVATQPPKQPVAGVVEVRYVLAASRLAGRATELRLLGAGGELLGAVTEHDDAPRRADVRVLARVRAGGRRAELLSFTVSELEPTPLDLARRVRYRCAGIRIPGVRPIEAEACAGSLRRRTVQFDTEDDCDGAGMAISGIVDPQIEQVVVQRGDGSRTRAVLRALPGDPHGRRAFAAVVPAHLATRRLLLIGPRGRVAETHGVGAPPTRSRCVQAPGAVIFGTVGSAAGPPAGTRLVVADGPEQTLCLGLDALRADDVDCHTPPLSRYLAEWSIARRDGDAWVISGVTIPEAVRVAVRFADGGLVTADTSRSIPGYRGVYDGRVPFFELRHAGPAPAARIALFDARGRELSRAPLFGPSVDRRLVGPPRHLGLGGIRLEVARVAVGDQVVPCVARAAPERRFIRTCVVADRYSTMLHADCATRRVLVSTVLSRATRSASIIGADGRSHPLRTVRVGDVRVAVAVLGPRVRASRLLLRGRRTDRYELAMPSAAEQCGYYSFVPRGR